MITFMDEQQSMANNPNPEELEGESDDIGPSASSSNQQQEPKSFGHIYLGAPQKLCELGVFEQSYPHFKHRKLLDFIKAELPLLDIPVPENLNKQITMQTKV